VFVTPVARALAQPVVILLETLAGDWIKFSSANPTNGQLVVRSSPTYKLRSAGFNALRGEHT